MFCIYVQISRVNSGTGSLTCRQTQGGGEEQDFECHANKPIYYIMSQVYRAVYYITLRSAAARPRAQF